QREFAETVQKSGESLLGIINDILDFSKIEAGRLTLTQAPFDPVDAVEDVLGLLGPSALGKGLELYADYADDLPARVNGDVGRLRQVLINFVGNAIKFTERGHIGIHVSATHAPDSRATLRFDVTDTGIGLPPDARDQLFQSFTQIDNSATRRHGGTGLGLAISRQLVELMGGGVQVTSESGHGSTFSFTVSLPVVSGTTQTPGTLPPDLSGRRRSE